MHCGYSGNGEHYKKTPNSERGSPGLGHDMLAFTP